MDIYTFTSQLIRRWSQRFTNNCQTQAVEWTEEEKELTCNVGIPWAPAIMCEYDRNLFLYLVCGGRGMEVWVKDVIHSARPKQQFCNIVVISAI